MGHDFECKSGTGVCDKKVGTYNDRFCDTDPSQKCTDIGSNMDYYEVNSMIICTLKNHENQYYESKNIKSYSF